MASIAVIVALTLFYTYHGGMTAVIWTDVVQMFLYVAGAVLSLFAILHQIPGGWTHVVAFAAPWANSRYSIFALAPNSSRGPTAFGPGYWAAAFSLRPVTAPNN